MTKFLLILIIMFNGNPEAEAIGEYDTPQECHKAKTEVIHRLGVPMRNYSLSCFMKEVI